MISLPQILTLITPTKNPFPNRATVTGPVGWDVGIFWGGATFQPLQHTVGRTGRTLRTGAAPAAGPLVPGTAEGPTWGREKVEVDISTLFGCSCYTTSSFLWALAKPVLDVPISLACAGKNAALGPG